ncbi:MAG TPA: hypothetical protein DCF68_00465 [Cyanothece sp. UBA12306]|nr:hypothetical protein [Cyanothece sp. UBA12306]
MISLDNFYALIIGISNYQLIPKLPLTVCRDAQDIYNLLINPLACGYSTDNVQFLLNEQATLSAFSQSLLDLAQRTTKNSTLLIYFSGYGVQLNKGSSNLNYLLPVDVELTSETTLVQTAISTHQFTEALQKISASKTVIIFDCYHSQDIKSDDLTFKMGLSEQYYNQLKQKQGRVIITSARRNEQSQILPDNSNSLFVKHLLNGLQGEAIATGGIIRILDLFNYVQSKVIGDNEKQRPIIKVEIEENFPLAKSPQKQESKPLSLELPMDEFRYDVFISYRHQLPDKTWVRKTLLPWLEERGFRVCIDYKDFRLGQHLIKEMERAVEQSRYTLSILSPAYLESNFTDLENVLAEHLGLETSQRRLLAIIRTECTPRLGMRSRLMLDMTDDDDFEMNMERLAYELQQPASN